MIFFRIRNSQNGTVTNTVTETLKERNMKKTESEKYFVDLEGCDFSIIRPATNYGDLANAR